MTAADFIRPKGRLFASLFPESGDELEGHIEAWIDAAKEDHNGNEEAQRAYVYVEAYTLAHDEWLSLPDTYEEEGQGLMRQRDDNLDKFSRRIDEWQQKLDYSLAVPPTKPYIPAHSVVTNNGFYT